MLGALCNGGESNAALSSPGKWEISFGYRWQDSFRHFVGDVEQPQRLLQQTQQENKIHLFDVALSYQATRRWSFNISGPFMIADRINHRTGGVTSARGLGDMAVGAKFWIWRPPTESRQNIQVGFSVKLPTGKPDVVSPVRNVLNAAPTTVDQSIQLGDSGVGLALDYLAYKSLPRRFTLFSTGVYLLNPKNTYLATTPGARLLSVPDQYLVRGGVAYAVPRLPGIALSIAGRDEGVPARDLIGREDGFRRPGYAVSIEPGIQFSPRHSVFALSYAIAVRRDRTRSVQDVAAGTHGDAAFADSVLLIGFSQRF